jgi:hypothetical protein
VFVKLDLQQVAMVLRDGLIVWAGRRHEDGTGAALWAYLMTSSFPKLVGRTMWKVAGRSWMQSVKDKYVYEGGSAPVRSRRAAASGAVGSAAAPSARTWAHNVSTLARSFLAAMPPQGLVPDHDVQALIDKDLLTVAVEFRRWIQQRLA